MVRNWRITSDLRTMSKLLSYFYENKLYFRLYCALPHLKQFLITVISASQTISKFNQHDFIGCSVLAQLPHFSCLFCKAMIGWACIAIQVNMSRTLTPKELVLPIFKKCWFLVKICFSWVSESQQCI